MRMWMVDSSKMCDNHLRGEHYEIHRFLVTLMLNRRVNGYVKNNLLEVVSLKLRHDELAEEMKKRGFVHKTPIYNSEINGILDRYTHDLDTETMIDKEKSLRELISRCPSCRKRFENGR